MDWRVTALAIAALCAPGLLFPARAQDRYCSADAANVTLYVDVTTPYDDLDRNTLVEGIGEIYQNLKGGERVSIRTIEDAFPNSDRLVEECVPYCPPADLEDFFTSNCTEGVVINDRKRLYARIKRSLSDRLAHFVELPKSEIIRTVAVSAREVYGKGKPNEIYIFSDMIDNSDSMAKGRLFLVPNEKLLKELARQRLIPDLGGASIHVFGIGRSDSQKKHELDPLKLDKLESFWRLFFAAAGATVQI